ncbi:MAG: amidohydrolase family protein, partial [Chloroflexi bacterium]|nr:amidohydrolase family protein [Chloroflexota bacterium]
RQDEQGQPENGWYPEEKISVAEAIQAYTLGPARLAGKEHLQGSLTPGKWADMIMLSQNLFEIDPVDIADTEVEMTVFAGQVVFER